MDICCKFNFNFGHFLKNYFKEGNKKWIFHGILAYLCCFYNFVIYDKKYKKFQDKKLNGQKESSLDSQNKDIEKGKDVTMIKDEEKNTIKNEKISPKKIKEGIFHLITECIYIIRRKKYDFEMCLLI